MTFTDLSLDIYRERDLLREQPDCALHVLYRPHSIFLPNEPIFLYLEDGRVRKAGFLTVGPPTPRPAG